MDADSLPLLNTIHPITSYYITPYGTINQLGTTIINYSNCLFMTEKFKAILFSGTFRHITLVSVFDFKMHLNCLSALN